MYIIGAGLAGCIAGVMNGGARILEASPHLPNNHQGLLRFRSDNISKITGISFKKVKVFKGIWSDGKSVFLSPRLANQYSLKVIGVIQQRSILNMDPVDRWIAPDDFHGLMGEMIGDRIIFNQKVSEIDARSIRLETGSHYWDREEKEPIISTMPMPLLSKVTGIGICEPFTIDDAKPVYSFRATIPDCDVHQTNYYPDFSIPIYRASIVGNQLIIESKEPALSGLDLEEVLMSFGISGQKLVVKDEWKSHKELGKLANISDSVRKSFMLDCSLKLNIWSLGRYACWRNILLDDVYYDIIKIRAMIGQHHYHTKLKSIGGDTCEKNQGGV